MRKTLISVFHTSLLGATQKAHTELRYPSLDGLGKGVLIGLSLL